MYSYCLVFNNRFTEFVLNGLEELCRLKSSTSKKTAFRIPVASSDILQCFSSSSTLDEIWNPYPLVCQGLPLILQLFRIGRLWGNVEVYWRWRIASTLETKAIGCICVESVLIEPVGIWVRNAGLRSWCVFTWHIGPCFLLQWGAFSRNFSSHGFSVGSLACSTGESDDTATPR